MTRIAPEDVQRIARLARVTLTDDEIVRLGQDLAGIVDYVSRLAELELPEDLRDEEAHAAPGPPGVLRADQPRPGLPREVVESEAPQVERGHFIVPQVVAP